ncbi:MAG: ribosomal-processing cysteine protease Prp [Ruminococcaceae bacterium]|nr:ribosomal-processing cysteine protease Prp [Oscillospiraceae bacterium]
MTKVDFFGSENLLRGFSITGHCTADSRDEQGRLVCAAVSSAVYMAANTLLEVEGAVCDIAEADGQFSLKVKKETPGTQTVLRGLLIHLQQLSEQYSSIELNLEV